MTVRRPAATVAEIMLDRPEAMNALSTAMGARLAAVCAELAADHGIRAVVLSAAGRAFCVGADLKERAAMSDADFMAQRPVFRAAFGGVLALRRLGPGRAADLVLTGRRIGAAEAERIGLADRLVPAGAAGQHAYELAERIAGNSPVSVQNAKRALRQGAGVPLAAGLEIEDSAWRAAAFSADRKEGIAAFVEKRKPQWPGA